MARKYGISYTVTYLEIFECPSALYGFVHVFEWLFMCIYSNPYKVSRFDPSVPFFVATVFLSKPNMVASFCADNKLNFAPNVFVLVLAGRVITR